MCIRDRAYGKLPAFESQLLIVYRGVALKGCLPTLDVASVKLLSVVLFPDEGLPTRPINGSRGMVSALRERLLLHRTGGVVA